MHTFDVIAIILVVAAILSYVNYRLLKLPTTIGLMILTMLLSLVIIIVGQVFTTDIDQEIIHFVEELRFSDTLLHGMLGFLLFAGALHIDLADLREFHLTITLLVIIGVLVSTAIIGFAAWWLLAMLGIGIPFLHCLLFGALISPTDPIAVLGLLKRLGAPRSLETKIGGESLFNDGIGVVVFLTLLQVAAGHHELSLEFIGELFLVEVIGGIVFGLAIGFLVFFLLKSIDNYQVEVLLSLALVAGGFTLAEQLKISAPLAMVVAGLMIGNHGRTLAMSKTTVEHLDMFWELVDDILNSILFVLIGLEILIVVFDVEYLLAALLAIPVALLARLAAVAAPISLMRWKHSFDRYTICLLTWGGLRGGISVALALSIPYQLHGAPNYTRDIILVMTYVVVVFSILVQGLTIGPLVRHWMGQGKLS